MRTKFLSLTSIAALMLLAVSGALYAQGGDGEIDPEELSEERLAYFGLGAGYQRMVTMLDYTGMNQVSRGLGLGDFSGPLSIDFGGLMFTPGFVQNLRLGIFAGTGTTQLSRQVRLEDTLYTRTIYFNSVLVTTEADYAITISNPFTIFPGVMIGAGRNTIGVSQTRSAGTRFGDVFDGGLFSGDPETNRTNLNRFARTLSYHLFLYPQLNFEYTLTPNIMIRIGAGYNTSLRLTDWADEGGVEMKEPPNISANGLSFQGGLFVGLFQH